MFFTRIVPGLLVICAINWCIAEAPARAGNQVQPLLQATNPTTRPISEDEVRQALEQIRSALQEKNLEGVMEFIAPFAYSEVIIDTDDSTRIVELEGKDKHRLFFEQGLTRIQESEDFGRQVRVSISSDGNVATATVYSVAGVTATDGKRFLSTENDTIRFGLVDERLMIVSTTLETTLAPRPPIEQ